MYHGCKKVFRPFKISGTWETGGSFKFGFTSEKKRDNWIMKFKDKILLFNLYKTEPDTDTGKREN